MIIIIDFLVFIFIIFSNILLQITIETFNVPEGGIFIGKSSEENKENQALLRSFISTH